jgi:hypothetical protein
MKTVSTLSREYPWGRTKPGESFFIPGLDTQQIIFEGLRAASYAGVSVKRTKAVPCIYKGLLGVMFKRP